MRLHVADMVPAEGGVEVLVVIVECAWPELQRGALGAAASRNVRAEVAIRTVIQDPEARVRHVEVLAGRVVAGREGELGAGTGIAAGVEAEVGAGDFDLRRAGLDAVRPQLVRIVAAVLTDD